MEPSNTSVLGQVIILFCREVISYSASIHLQVADFGMARDLMEADYYVSNGGEIPVKWTALEVSEGPVHIPGLCLLCL